MSLYARRAGLVLGAGSVYVGAVYLGLQLYGDSDKKRAIESAMSESNASTPTKSYIRDPQRTATFEKIAYAYDDEIAKDEIVMGINLLRRALLYFHAKGQVLEVGAGTGRNLGYYPGEKTVQKVFITDLSEKMLLKAREKIKEMPLKERSRYEVATADATDLRSYPDNSFDTVVDSFGLCSFDDPIAVLRELQRVCKPDGKILLLEHGRSHKYEGLTNYLDKHAERHAKNWGCCWNRNIIKIVSDSGLVLDKLDTWHFGTTYYAVCRPGKK